MTATVGAGNGEGGATARPAGFPARPPVRFIGSHTNKIDAKGRVSTPADFRKALEGAPFHGVVCFPAFTGQVIDGGGLDLLDAMMEMIERLDPYGDDREEFELTVMGESRKLPFDGDGRIILPEEFRAYAGLDTHATFVGRGARFQIWNPDVYAETVARARPALREKRHLLHPPRPRSEAAE